MHSQKAIELPLIKTKLNIPKLQKNIISRPRLISKLSEGIAHGRRVTLVSAPAGYGKSTLLAEYVQGSKLHNVWLSLDDNDNEALSFLRYVILGIDGIIQGLRSSVSPLLSFPQLPKPEYLAAFIIDGLSELKEPLIIVFDDMQCINNRYIFDFLQYIIDNQPELLHMAILTREDPPLLLGRLRGRQQLNEIRERDLKLTEEELLAYFKKSLDYELDKDMILTIGQRTEGWAAGLQLACLSMQSMSTAEAKAFALEFCGSNRYVFEYLYQEVMQRLSEEEKTFLIHTSVLDSFSAVLCDAVTDKKDNAKLLEKLYRANHFIISLDNNSNWYRYHNIFASFLQSELNIEQKGTVFEKAALWFEGQGLMEGAVKYALRSNRQNCIASTIPKAVIRKFQEGDLITVSKWLDSLPQEMLADNTELQIYKAWCCFLTGRTGESGYLMKEMLKKEAGLDRAETISMYLSLKSLYQMRANPLEAIETAKRAVQTSEGIKEFYRISSLLSLGQAQASNGNSLDAATTFKEAYILGEHINYEFASITALVNAAANLNWIGRREEAISLCEKAQKRHADQNGRLLPLGELIGLVLGMLYYESNELEKAYEQLKRGIAVCRQLSLMQMIGFGEWFFLLTVCAMKRYEEAAVLLTDLKQLELQLSGGSAQLSETLKADFDFRSGNIEAASVWADKFSRSANCSPEQEMGTMKMLQYFIYIRIRLAQGKGCDKALEALESQARATGRNRHLITIYLLTAQSKARAGVTADAKSYVEKALELARPEKYTRAFLDEGTIISLLKTSGSRTSDFVASILGETADENPRENGTGSRPDEIIESLSHRESEILELIAGGCSNEDISQKLYITVGTVKWHIANIFGKLGVKRRTQAVDKAKSLKLI